MSELATQLPPIPQLRVVTRNYPLLRGLIFVPAGVLVLVLLADLGPVATLALLVLCWLVQAMAVGYYSRRFGAVRPLQKAGEHKELLVVLVLSALAGGVRTLDFGGQLPIDLTLLLAGVAVLYLWHTRLERAPGLQYHQVVGLLVLAASLAPTLAPSRSAYYEHVAGPLAQGTFGFILLVLGILNHRFLVRTLSPAPRHDASLVARR